MNKKQQTIKRRILRTADVLEICMYCGEPAEEREHVYPRSLFRQDTPKVWSCRECNGMASNKVFDGIEEKRDYIHTKIRRKYAWVYKTPYWDDDEIAQLGYSLKTEIKSAMETRKATTRRLEWRTNVDAMIVAKTLQSVKIHVEEAKDATGKDSVTLDAAIDGIRNGDLKRWYWAELPCGGTTH